MVVVWVGCQGGGFPLIIGFGLPGGVGFAFLGVGCLLVCFAGAALFVRVLGALVLFLALLVVY